MLFMTNEQFPIFKKLGGLKAAIALIRRSSIRPSWPSVHTVAYWRRRGRIPPHVELLLRDAAKEQGIRYSMSDYEYRPAARPVKGSVKAARKRA